jgi:hypothetical protein
MLAGWIKSSNQFWVLDSVQGDTVEPVDLFESRIASESAEIGGEEGASEVDVAPRGQDVVRAAGYGGRVGTQEECPRLGQPANGLGAPWIRLGEGGPAVEETGAVAEHP